MLEDTMRTVAFFCPTCRKATIIARSAFQLAASRSVLDCPCGKSAVELEALGDKLRLKVPCLLCEQLHSFTCSTHAFLHEHIMAFSCVTSGLDCCYVGDEEPVYAAMERLEETIDGLEMEAGAEGVFLNPVIMQEVLEELRDIGARGGISCRCGSKAFGMQIQFSAVELQCSACGGLMKIPASTLGDIEDLCCKPSLLIHGKEP